MSGHRRTVPAPGARSTSRGVVRRNRTHLPDGAADEHTREREISGGKNMAHARIRERRGDPAGQIDAAREYLRSALRGYAPADPDLVDGLVQQMTRTADHIIRTGTRRSARSKNKKGGGRGAA